MIYRDDYDYLAKESIYFKSGSSSETYDAVYNAGMLDLSEHQQEMADELFEVYKNGTGGHYEDQQVEVTPASTGTREVASGGGGGRDGYENGTGTTAETYTIPAVYETQSVWVSDGSTAGYMDLEQAQVDSNMELIAGETALSGAQTEAEASLLPAQTALSGAQTSAELSLLPGQTALTAKEIADQSALIDQVAPVRQAFYQQATEGIDAEESANRAAADAAQAFMSASSTTSRDAARMGVDPNSGRFTAMQTGNEMEMAKAIGSARTTARTQAEEESFGMLETAMSYGG